MSRLRDEFKNRSSELERLDKGAFTETEYFRWQREMWWIHRLRGEFPALIREIRAHAPDTGPISLLDVGSGPGELLSGIGTKWPDARLTAVDGSSLAVRAAAERRIDSVQAEARSLPFSDGSFDISFSCLTLHHFSDCDAVNVLREMKRVSRRRVIVVDLERHPMAYYLYRAAGRFLLQGFTFEDGSLSIRRGFRETELRHLGEAAGLQELSVYRFGAYRLVLTGI